MLASPLDPSYSIFSYYPSFPGQQQTRPDSRPLVRMQAPNPNLHRGYPTTCLILWRNLNKRNNRRSKHQEEGRRRRRKRLNGCELRAGQLGLHGRRRQLTDGLTLGEGLQIKPIKQWSMPLSLRQVRCNGVAPG